MIHVGSVWTNLKTSKPYVVICVAEDATNSRPGEIVVVYRGTDLRIWCREKAEFLTKFIPGDW